jgi:hypothetical protein
MLKPKVVFNQDLIRKAKQRMEERAAQAKRTMPNQASVGIHEAEGSQPKLDYYGKPTDTSLAQVAAIHEFTDRSWLRTWFDQNRSRLASEMVKAGRAENEGEPGAIGEQAKRWAEELREWIEYQDGGLKALQPSTVAAKERAGLESPTVPLVATHQLVSSIKAMLDGNEP